MSKIKINKGRTKANIRKVLEMLDNVDFEKIINENTFVKAKDTSEALKNENYYFSNDIAGLGTTFKNIESGVFTEKRIAEAFNHYIKVYDGDVRTKCDIDDNFATDAVGNQLHLVMMDTVKTFGFGDHVIKKYSYNGFEFYVKVRCDIPIADTIKHWNSHNEDEYLIEFKEHDMKFLPETVESRKENIIINFYFPCMVNKSKEINNFLGGNK